MNKKHILVCDDDPEILDMVTHTLTLNPVYEVTAFKTGEDVLEYVGHSDSVPDLLILDLWLPGIDGDKVASAIRENELTAEMPIILISAIINAELIAQEVGAQDYLSKPFLLEELEYKVGQLVLD